MIGHLFILVLGIFLINFATAHCPLCVVGAGAATVGASWLGINKIVIGLFLGAFAMSMGMWFSKIIKKGYIPFQKTLIIVGVFISTVLPLLPVFSAIGPLYVPFVGSYGKTYIINYALWGSILGGLITFSSPILNRKLREKRNGKGIPYQGILLTFIMLLIAAVLIELFI